jgi:hypothetical protein
MVWGKVGGEGEDRGDGLRPGGGGAYIWHEAARGLYMARGSEGREYLSMLLELGVGRAEGWLADCSCPLHLNELVCVGGEGGSG